MSAKPLTVGDLRECIKHMQDDAEVVIDLETDDEEEVVQYYDKFLMGFLGEAIATWKPKAKVHIAGRDPADES